MDKHPTCYRRRQGWLAEKPSYQFWMLLADAFTRMTFGIREVVMQRSDSDAPRQA